jgi:hypothetical protein
MSVAVDDALSTLLLWGEEEGLPGERRDEELIKNQLEKTETCEQFKCVVGI